MIVILVSIMFSFYHLCLSNFEYSLYKMIYIINLIVSLAFTWITYFVYNAMIMKYERFIESLVNFIRRFLFHSAIVFIIPLLFINVVELQHHKYLTDHNYSKIIKQIDQLPFE